MNQPPEGPVRVYFFERPDGSKIHVTERAAWDLFARPQQTMSGPQKFKYLGRSSGLNYHTLTFEAAKLYKEDAEGAKLLLKEAWDKELELATKDLTPPPNFDRVDKTGSPVDMARL